MEVHTDCCYKTHRMTKNLSINSKEAYRYHYNFLNKNFVYKLICFGAVYFPKYLADKIGWVIAAVLYFSLKDVRKRQYKNIRHILGNGADERQVRAVVLEVWRNWGQYLLDFFRFTNLNSGNLSDFVAEIKGKDTIDKALAKGRGAIIFTAHLGHWELGALCLKLTGYKTNVIMSPYESPDVNITVGKIREKNGITTIPIDEGSPSFIINVLKALRNNELVTIQGDRDVEKKGLLINFFGSPAYFPKGPMLLAMKTKSPVIPAFTFMDSSGLYHSIAEEEMQIDDTGDDTKDLRTNMERMVKVIERYVRKYPEQWYNFYYFWEK